MPKEALFETIAQRIKENIENEVYPDNQKLPSEYQLAETFEVSRLTVRRAIDLLIQQHVIVKQRGRGSYPMATFNKIKSGEDGLVGFTESAHSHGKTSHSHIVSLDFDFKAPFELQEALHLNQDDTLCHISRLRYFDDDPMTLEEIYLPTHFLPSVDPSSFKGSLFELVEQQTAIGYSHQEIEASLVDQKLSDLLQVPIGDPVLLVHTTTYAPNGEPILVDHSYYRADKYTFKNVLYRNK